MIFLYRKEFFIYKNQQKVTSISDVLLNEEDYHLTKYGHKFKYDETGNICQYYLISGDNYNSEHLIYEEYYDEENNVLQRRNHRNMYPDNIFIQYDSYGRIKKYSSDSTNFEIIRDNEYHSGRIIKIKDYKNNKEYTYSYDDLGYVSYQMDDDEQGLEFKVVQKEKQDQLKELIVNLKNSTKLKRIL